MGNASSNSESEDDGNLDPKDDDVTSDVEVDLEKESGTTLDLMTLFDHTLLRAAAAKIKEDIPENTVQQHHGHLVRWLEERNSRNEERVSLAQFCDVLMNRSVSREESIQAFQQFDSEGDGTADVATMCEALKSYSGANLHRELSYVIRMLQACTLTPGFIDVFTEDKQAVGQHGIRILSFLLRNRATSSSLPFPLLYGFNNTMTMRHSVLNSHFSHLKDSVNLQQEESILASGEELKPITKCFSSIDVSTNKADAHRLTNGDFSSSWQSDGSARSHWIRLRMRNNVVIKQLSIGVACSDQSYMPQLVSVAVGRNMRSLREIKEIKIASSVTGDVVLLENCKTFHPVIQINIKRCHSDGCDTRIHSLKTLGYRVVKDVGISVTDASAVWYLQVLVATATACMPVAPHLKQTILEHTKSALRHMAPLSLAPGSSEKPVFLSQHVLKEMDKFLTEIAKDYSSSMSREGLEVLLSFNLARGHVAGILRTLLLLQDYKSTELLELSRLLRSMDEVKEVYWKKHGSLITLTLAGCDGAKKENNPDPSNVLRSDWTTSQVYLTEDGKTKVNMFFRGADLIQITKLRIKVDRGPRGPKRGMVFVYQDSNPFNLNKHVEKFIEYDSWGQVEYNFCSRVRSNFQTRCGLEGKSDQPVAYFTVEEDWDEIEVPLDVCPVGQYVLVKFLEPRQTCAERLGIVGIKFYGFHRKSVFTESISADKQAVLHSTEASSTGAIFCKTLAFLVELARDQLQCQKRVAQFTRWQALDTADVSLDLLWRLYRGFPDRSEEKVLQLHSLTLQLLHSLFPFLTNAKEANKNAAEIWFRHLCSLADKSEALDLNFLKIIKQVIVDGAAVFFPDKEARRKQLFNMMNNVSGSPDAASVALTFQSLCQFFSSVDPSGLLDLPSVMSENFDSSPVLAVMETLVSVAYREFVTVMDTMEASTDQWSHLVQLLCSLQTSLLVWCQQHVNDQKLTIKSLVENVVCKYVQLLTDKSIQAFHLFDSRIDDNDITEDKKTILKTLMESSFLASSTRQLVLILGILCDSLASPVRVKLLHTLLPLAQQLKSISAKLPKLFLKVDSDQWEKLEKGEVVLRTWEVESPHEYENNMHITQTFVCPGAATFIVDFDPRCETERRYDYLEFTDSKGVKTRYDQHVGNEKWPLSTTFSGHKLQFLFHSDSNNSEWGYKFKVTAKGCPDVALFWMFDLHLGLAKLFGQFCGATLNSQAVSAKVKLLEQEEEDGPDLLTSELWTTLFRGGYMVGKLQRSLSGRHVASDSNSACGALLWSLVEGEKDSMATNFLSCVRKGCSTSRIGGEELDQAVVSVFAALLWHTQALRDDVEKFIKNENEGKIMEGIHQAYNTAESMRTHLMELRQKQRVAAEKNPSNESPDPVTSCIEKAKFLLQFAGLSKIPLRTEMRMGKSNKHPGKKKLYNRQLSSPHDRTSVFKFESSAVEKYPAFKLVLEFVRDPAWVKERVQELLQLRSSHAMAVSDVYMFLAEYLRLFTEDHIFEICNLLLLQETLVHQEKFAKHYADGLEGCGLELESRVRLSFYTLIRRLLDAVRSVNREELSKNMMTSFDCLQAYTLHLLDVNWQLYDLSFVADVKIAEFYMAAAKGSVTMREKTRCVTDEAAELEEYRQYMKWYQECQNNNNFMEWYRLKCRDANKEERKSIQMFVARFCDLLDVEITCDGCGVTLPGRRYRCLQCQDMDLCATCYAGGVKPVGNHSEEHDIVHLMYKCDACQAFISGTRIHCSVCHDFDLCVGCQKAGEWPSGHTADHEVVEHPQIKLKLSSKSDNVTQSYIHQHVWLQFVSLSLCMASVIHITSKWESETEDSNDVDKDYARAAIHIHNQCIHLAMECLMKVPKDGDLDSAVTELEKDMATQQEEAFAAHAQERIMGLLGAMIPPEDKTPSQDLIYSFTDDEFLKLLFIVATGESGHEVNTQHLAMGLIGQLLKRPVTSCKVADEAVAASKHTEAGPDLADGQFTAQFLFSFGATCLERSGLDWACSMAQILQKLFNTTQWRPILFTQLTESLDRLTEKPELSSIFALFVISGFPEVLSLGSLVQYSDFGAEMKTGIILKHFPDKNQTLLVDVKSRRRYTLQDKFVECTTQEMNVLDKQHIVAFVNIIKDIVDKIKYSSDVGVEKVWVLALAMKALLKTISQGIDKTIADLFNTEFIQGVVYMAGLGTGFSRLWLLKDLEVLSLMLYTRDHGNESEEVKGEEKRTVKKSTKRESLSELKPSKSDGSSSASDACEETASDKQEDEKKEAGETFDPMDNLDDAARWCFQTLNEHLSVPLSVLRVIYDMNERNTDALLMAIHENHDGSTYNASDEIKEQAKKWEKATSKITTDLVADRSVDTGIHMFTFAKSEKRTLDAAVEEPSEDMQRLIRPSISDIWNDVIKQRKTHSTHLLKKELESQGRAGSREFLTKVNMAMAVLYARQVLLSLLADWVPTGHMITAELLGCKQSSHIPFVLDLLNRTDNREIFSKVIKNVIEHCDQECLVPIATTGCQFMEEVSHSTITKESEHKYKNATTLEDSVHIPGAAFLAVKFDSRCSTEESCDELTLATSADYSLNKHVFSGPPERWVDFEVPGDTVFFKFTSDESKRDWGYKFTVTGGRQGRFDTGYVILNNVLTMHNAVRLLPVGELWHSLVYVTCKQTGQQRLKAIQLLQRLLQTQFRTFGNQEVLIELHLLKPLWRLYRKSAEGSSATTPNLMMSPLKRALTDLFLVAEDLALDWDIADDYVSALYDKEDILQTMAQGVQNVAMLSAAINYQNKATKACARTPASETPAISSDNQKV